MQNFVKMDHYIRKRVSNNMAEKRTQRRDLRLELNAKPHDGQNSKSEVREVDLNLNYIDFLNEFVFEKPTEDGIETVEGSLTMNKWVVMPMDACNDDVFKSPIRESETFLVRKSRLSLLRMISKFSESKNRKRSIRSDYGSMTSTSQSSSSNRESAIPEEATQEEEAMPFVSLSDCPMDSGSDIKTSERTDSTDSDEGPLRYLRYDSVDSEKLLSNILLAVHSLTLKEEFQDSHESTVPSKPNSTAVSKSRVVTFLQDIFEVSGEKIDKIISNRKKIVKVNLNMKVFEAKIPRPKYFTGEGNFYVVINIQNTSQRFRTRAERGTLNPIWNQNFILDTNDWSNDVLNLEVWNVFETHDLQRVLHKGKKEKLVGSSQVPIKYFLENRGDEWFPLRKKERSKGAEKQPSVIRFRCEVCVVDDDKKTSDRRGYHELLAKVVNNQVKIQSNVDEFPENINIRWSGKLSSVAQITMDQYSAFLGLKDPAIHLSWWLICSSVQSIDYGYLFEQLLKIQSHMGSTSFSETDLQQLTNSFCELIKLSLRKIKYLRINFPPEKCNNDRHSFDAFLRILVNVQSHAKSNHLLESRGVFDVLQQVEAALICYAKEWWSKKVEQQLKGVLKPEEQLKAAERIASETISFLDDIIKYYGPPLIRLANIPYFQHVFAHFAIKLKQCVYPPLIITYNQFSVSKGIQYESTNKKEAFESTNEKEAFESTNEKEAFESTNEKEAFENGLCDLWMKLYCHLGSLHRMSLTLPLEVQLESEIERYHIWFDEALHNWIEIKKQRSGLFIRRAVELDTLNTIHQTCQYSSSAVDVIDIMWEVLKLWKSYNWEESNASLAYLPQILELICSCKTTYVDLLMKKVVLAFDDSPDRSVAKYRRFCTVLNNIKKVRKEFLRMFEPEMTKMNISPVKMDEKDSTTPSSTSLKSIIDNTIENIVIEASELIEIVIEKICDELRGRVTEVTCESYKAAMVDFLNPLFEVIHRNLNDESFQWFIRRFWEVFVGLFKEMVMESTKKHGAHYFKEIDLITEELLSFVAPADVINLRKKAFLSEDYLSLKSQLEYMKMSSECLISKYFSERLADQEDNNIPCTGKLVVRASFRSGDKLIAEVILAEKMEFNSRKGIIPPLSRLNSCADPYVTVELVPKIWFQEVHKVRTKIQWNSDPAVFNETFDMEIGELKDSNRDNGFILFTLRDMNRRRSSNLIGETLVPLKNLSDKGKNLYLKVTKPRTDDGYQTVPVLKQRTTDPIAILFLKERYSASKKLCELAEYFKNNL